MDPRVRRKMALFAVEQGGCSFGCEVENGRTEVESRSWGCFISLLVYSCTVVVHGLSCPAVCGIFSDQGSNTCSQVDRQTLNHWTTREVSWRVLNLNWILKAMWETWTVLSRQIHKISFACGQHPWPVWGGCSGEGNGGKSELESDAWVNFLKYLFIWLRQVLVAAQIFSCGIRTLSCSM